MSVFRKEYKPLSQDQKDLIDSIKDKADELMIRYVTDSGISIDPRYMALAKTELENSVMWAVKAIT